MRRKRVAKCRICLKELKSSEQRLCDSCWQRELFVSYDLTPQGKEAFIEPD